MNELMIWIWVSVFLLSVILEILTLDLVGIWFSFASIPAFILALFPGVWPWLQVVVFLVVSSILLILTRPFLVKYFKRNETKTNVDAYMGTIGTALNNFKAGENGEVKVKNLEWRAVSSDDITKGDSVRVLDIEGVTLIVEKI